MAHTGERCPTSGHYKDGHGHEIIISAGDVFPPCPWNGTGVTWKFQGR